MKSFINLLLIIIFFQSCSKNNQDHELLGNWSSTNSSNTIGLQFFKDSLIQETFETKTKFTWRSKGSKIYYTQLTNIKQELESDFVVEYSFSTLKDTLFIKKEIDSSFALMFVKTNNAYQLFKKSINFEIDLPKKEKELILSENKEFDYNIYVGLKKGKLIVKTNKSINLDRINTEIYDLILSTKDQDAELIKYMLFVDRRVSKKDVDSIKNILKGTEIKKVFRVYTNSSVNYEKTDWKDELNWYGQYE